jgi:hypothetical protein
MNYETGEGNQCDSRLLLEIIIIIIIACENKSRCPLFIHENSNYKIHWSNESIDKVVPCSHYYFASDERPEVEGYGL